MVKLMSKLNIDGCPMGGCISPTMANIFLNHHETEWLNQCPSEFKPILYRRYVDDTFLLFKCQSHVSKFHEYINAKHPRIKFTVENERNNSLPFLDVLVSKVDSKFETSTYRKPTHTGLGMKAKSAISTAYKKSLIECLVDRATKINSSHTALCKEIHKLKTYFCQNGFNLKWVQNIINRKIELAQSGIQPIPTVSKLKIYCKLPYMSSLHNRTLEIDLKKLVGRFYPYVDLKIIFQNNNTIGKMFPFKDVIPNDLRSNIVYKFTCGMCDSTYIGETTRHFRTRVSEHMGISPRTGNPSSIVTNVREHCETADHPINPSNFSILQTGQANDIMMLESIAIHSRKPTLNGTTKSTPLYVLG